jgi:DNA-binding MarR family transcriptional regulator
MLLYSSMLERLPEMAEIQEFSRYINEIAGIPMSEARSAPPPVPAAISGQYALLPARVAEHPLTAIYVKDPDRFSPANFSRHLRMMPEHVQRSYLVIADRLRPHVRRRLVFRHVPFVVPGVQINWPELGVAFRKRGSVAVEPKLGPHLSPASQVVLIGMLLDRIPSDVPSVNLAEHFDYTPMSISRALDELEENGFIRVEREGRERRPSLAGEGRKIWERAKPMFRSPVRQQIRVDRNSIDQSVVGLDAGETALAKSSMLSEPREPVVAVGPAQWIDLKQHAEEVPSGEEWAMQLQIWRYDPHKLAVNGIVDPLSLYLSLEGVKDERVRMSLDELMAKVPWRS